jgi:type IV secretion system protein VirB10
MNKDNFEKNNNLANQSEIESKIVTVGSNKGHRALMVAIVVLIVGVVYYFYFRNPGEENSEIAKKQEVKQNIQELQNNLEKVPDNIVAPERIITNPLPPLPSLPTPQVIPEVKQPKKEEEVKKEDKPKATVSNIPSLSTPRSPSNNLIIDSPSSFPIIGSSGYPKDRRGTQMLAISGGGDKDSKSDDVVLSNTSAQSSKATRVGRLDLMITQGKIIDAVLETAINSDLQGMLRAVVSRDVYAEVGDTVLIPKGSKLIGRYTFDSNVAKSRVNINWNRVILPHGIDIAIASSGTDEIGRAGIRGIVDNKIVSALFSSIALAGVSIGTAVVGQKASNLVDVLTIMDAARSIVGTEINFYSFKDVIFKGLKQVSVIKEEKWKLGPSAIGKMQDANNEQDLLRIMKEEIAKVLNAGLKLESQPEDITSDQIGITLEDVKALLRQIQKKSKSVYETAVEKSITDFSKDMRDIIERSTDKKPTIYVDQGTALKVFVGQDIVFPPQAVLHR